MIFSSFSENQVHVPQAWPRPDDTWPVSLLNGVMSHGGAQCARLVLHRLLVEEEDLFLLLNLTDLKRGTDLKTSSTNSSEMCNGQTYPKTLMKNQKCNFPCKTTPKRIATYKYKGSTSHDISWYLHTLLGFLVIHLQLRTKIMDTWYSPILIYGWLSRLFTLMYLNVSWILWDD